MRHVLSLIDHVMRGTGALLSWHPSPEVQFLGQAVSDLARSEAVRLWVRITAQVHWTRLTARLSRRRDR
ncbi:hypothetical protein ABT174_20895 [Streptomyces sparsogenes]|uniref:hypothetical protein n=1 Tax=Streptomyces sparsogenes TaxID=67365 RepID=UPI003324FB86